jgi:hypothetical protein
MEAEGPSNELHSITFSPPPDSLTLAVRMIVTLLLNHPVLSERQQRTTDILLVSYQLNRLLGYYMPQNYDYDGYAG